MVNLNKEKTKIAEVRLIDFGLAKEIASAQNVSSAGTREFLCPQIAHPEKFKSEEKKEPLPSEVYKSIYKYNDVYAFGVTLFMLISGGKKTSLVPVETSVEKDKIEEDVKKQWKERTRKESTTMKISKIAKLIADCVAYEEQPTMEKVCGEYFPDAKDTK